MVSQTVGARVADAGGVALRWSRCRGCGTKVAQMQGVWH